MAKPKFLKGTAEPPPRSKLCCSVEIGGLPVLLYQNGVDRFTVIYWKQIKTDLGYGAAAAEFGKCVMHAATLDGKLDNRERGVRVRMP